MGRSAETLEQKRRRVLHLADWDAAIEECRSLSERGYMKTGNWSLGQICEHVRRTVEANMDGYPSWMVVLGFPLRPILRHFLLPRLLQDQAPAGIKTAGLFIPADNADDLVELEALEQCVTRFNERQGDLYPHPGFGRMTKAEFEHFHAAHLAHHLSFLQPLDA